MPIQLTSYESAQVSDPKKNETDLFIYRTRGSGDGDSLFGLFHNRRYAYVAGDSLDAQFSLDWSDSGGRGDAARILLCSCERRQYWSVAARIKERKQSEPPRDPGELTWKPSTVIPDKTIVSIDEICKAICKIGKNAFPDKGLIVIAGATSAGKSQTAEGLLYYSLNKFKDDKTISQIRDDGDERKNADPIHVLTLQSPIVEPLIEGGNAGQPPIWPQDSPHLVYATRRSISAIPEKNDDARSVQQVLELDARRQKPNAVYIDEVRSDEDWPHSIDFALTSHLVITTTHASTLAETISRICRACKAVTPEDRARIARAICLVVHIALVTVDKDGLILPSIWVRSPQSIKGLAWPGLSSLIPRTSQAENATVGRTEMLITHLRNPVMNKLNGDDTKFNDLLKQAIKKDREGC